MELNSNRLLTVLAPALLVMFISGCATPVAWKATAPRRWQPRSLDEVLLVTNTNRQSDVVVLFKQLGIKENSMPKTRCVGWRISEPTNHMAFTSKAIRQLTNSVVTSQIVPFYNPQCVPTGAATKPPGFAIFDMATCQLWLHMTVFHQVRISYQTPLKRFIHGGSS